MKLAVVGLLAVAGLALTAKAQIGIVPSSAAFRDISVTGTAVASISDDSNTIIAGATIGWVGNGLLAGGMSINVGNNGGVTWGTSATDTFASGGVVGYINSSTFMTMAASNASTTGNGNGARQFLAVLWDDNFPSTVSVPPTSIKWQVIGTDLVVQWTNEDHFNAQGNGFVTYEMIAHGGVSLASGASLVDFVYQDTQYAPNQYQNDGGSASIGYKNWGLNGGANDVQWGLGGGTDSLGDPAFGGTNMQPKVAGYLAADNPSLTHAVSIVPAPGALALLGLGGLLTGRRRR
jgi:MYXO-CTERM domain-containing protein